ncbi:hypothetical protein [Telluribacter sp. SYSU D00476]|uniref:hypothetical protein n=1 Tax=Telluribacter sp. SYSU D00476 TaxID=2811430 RepID=UPI001FF2C61E|nr:hypothetical protein [Telluribacter sp. SYSU D00476]
MNYTKHLLYYILLGPVCILSSCQYMSYTSSKAGVCGGLFMLVLVLVITIYIVSKTLTNRD